MNREQAAQAAKELAEHPAAKHIMIRVDGTRVTRRCKICNDQQERNVHPVDDAGLFAWFKEFSDAHIHADVTTN